MKNGKHQNRNKNNDIPYSKSITIRKYLTKQKAITFCRYECRDRYFIVRSFKKTLWIH